MRDIEILARYLSFRFFAEGYPGRMKKFLDESFEDFNRNWKKLKPKVESATQEFEAGVLDLIRLFGDNVARKPDSRQFNRAIFDALIYFQAKEDVRRATKSRATKLRDAYKALFSADSGFLKAVESDTAGAPNTSARLTVWAETLSQVTGTQVLPPKIPLKEPGEAQQARKKHRHKN